jgi:hypothetical protein
MTDMTIDPGRRRQRHEESLEFRLLLVITYPVFLAAALIDLLLPARLRFFAIGGERSVNIFARAWTAAHTTIPFVFMG